MNLRYTPWGAYGQSKLANLLFAYELDRRCRAKGLSVVANALHPGVVNTELFRYPLGIDGLWVAEYPRFDFEYFSLSG